MFYKIQSKRKSFMKRLLVVIGVFLFVAALAYARAPKDYQVTGPVLEMDGDHMIVQTRDKCFLEGGASGRFLRAVGVMISSLTYKTLLFIFS